MPIRDVFGSKCRSNTQSETASLRTDPCVSPADSQSGGSRDFSEGHGIGSFKFCIIGAGSEEFTARLRSDVLNVPELGDT